MMGKMLDHGLMRPNHPSNTLIPNGKPAQEITMKKALLTTMTPDELIRTLNKDIETITMIKGVNNHMGSKMTQNAEQINQIFSILKANNI